jgi:hypothetical protein
MPRAALAVAAGAFAALEQTYFSGNDPILALVGSYRPRGRGRTLEVRLF